MNAMRYLNAVFLFAIVITLSGCGNIETKNESENITKNDNAKVPLINSKDNNSKFLIERGDKIANDLNREISIKRSKLLNNNEIEAAFTFCNENALKITDSIANVEGVVIKRLAKKNRNSENEMDDIESDIFKQYLLQWLNNQPIDSKLSIDENGHPVYYRPIFIKRSCLNCHGKPETDIKPEINKLIAEKYPDDKAINFKQNQPRGMISITFTEITVDIAK